VSGGLGDGATAMGSDPVAGGAAPGGALGVQ
jgi:hypothetical protein